MGIEFTAGEYQTFTAVTKFKLGGPGQDIEQGSRLEFDGSTLRYAGKEFQDMTSLRRAIPTLIVPVGTEGATYRPQPAGVPLHKAQTSTPKRAEIQSHVVHADEQSVGEVNLSRPRRSAAVEGDEGVVVGTLRRPAVQRTVVSGENVMQLRQEILKMDDTNGSSTVASRVIPREGVDTTVQVSSGSSPIGGLSGGDDVIVAKLPRGNVTGEGHEPHLTAAEKDARAAAVAANLAARRAQAGDPPQGAPTVAPTPPPAPVGVTFEDILQEVPSAHDVFTEQGVDDIDTLRAVFGDAVAGPELARALKAGPTMKVRKLLGL